ncbi:metallophosphoesterase [Candidatus Sumerlaeota bacterium]|nr:metallophosphoesterase [Candidatus Sumerlaeota bacterium]
MRALAAALMILAAWGPSVSAQTLAMNAGTPTSVEFAAPEVLASEPLRIAILSDRTMGWPEGLDVLRAAVAEVVEASPAMVLTIGDMVNGYTRHEEDWLAEFEEWRECVAPLDVPLVPVAGNHDTSPGTEGIDDPMNERLFQEHFGPLCGSFDVGRTHFILLYSEDGPSGRSGLGEEQMDWLAEDLADLDADHLFVLMHTPLFDREWSNWDEVHEMLVETGIARAVIAGHVHTFQRFPDRDGIAYWTLGVTGGESMSAPVLGGLQHWALLTIDGDDWDLEIKRVGGDWIPNDDVLSEDAELASRFRWVRPWEVGPLGPLPYALRQAVDDAPLSLIVTNPLDDRPVSVEIALETDRGDQWVMEPRVVTRSLAPGASEEIAVTFSRPRDDEPEEVEPELDFTFTFEDSRGRRCPVTVERRLPWLMHHRILAQRMAERLVDGYLGPLDGWEGALSAGLPTWNTAPWETREPGGTVRIKWTGTDEISLFFKIFDERLEDYPENQSDTILSDAVVLRSLSVSAEEQAIAIFPHREGSRRALRVLPDTPESQWPELEGVEVAARPHNVRPEYQMIEMELPIALWMGEDWYERPPIPVNIEVHDNDGRQFTDIRSWAPSWSPFGWAVVTFGPRAR